MDSPKAAELTSRVLVVADTLLRESQRLFRPFGVTAAQYNVLNLLAGARAGLSQRELGDLLVVDRSNVTGLLDRLEKAGWVRRCDDPDDRRIYRVVLTADGRRLWEKVTPAYEEVLAHVVGQISEKNAQTALRVLDQLQVGAKSFFNQETKS